MTATINRCTCGVRIIHGQVERHHDPACACSVVPRSASERYQPPATAKQLNYLRHLYARAGEPQREPQTMKAASAEINRLVGR